MFKKIAIGAVGLALPLAMGAPAYAGERDHGGYGHDDSPDIKITDVGFNHGKFVVDVDYNCEPDYSEAKVWVKLQLGRSSFTGWKTVDCDDDEASVYLYGHGRVQSGRGYVDAYIKEKDGDTAHDDATVRVYRHGGHHDY